MKTRPHFSRISTYSYKTKSGTNPVPGIGIFRGRELTAHLTPSEAIELANTLADLVEKLSTDERTTA